MEFRIEGQVGFYRRNEKISFITIVKRLLHYFISYNNSKKKNVIASEAWRSCEMSSCPRLLRRIFNTPRNDGRTAFSLIELSIVLIIIGLLVAGVTGGKSLIESARSRALINELREYERAVWTFRAARDRFPGDVMNYGTFGAYSNYCTYSFSAAPYYTYNKTDFSAPYDTGSFTPNYISAPFVDLYTEGIIDFKPLGNSETGNKTSASKGTPNSKAIDTNNLYLYFLHIGTGTTYSGTPASNKLYYTGIRDFGSVKETIAYSYQGYSASKGMDPKILKQVDLKLDDGEHWNGRFRGCCYGTNSAGYNTYDNAIENGKKCSFLLYAL